MTPPTIAPVFDFFVPLLLSWPVEVLVGDGEPEPVELPDNETVEGTGASNSGKPPADFAARGSNRLLAPCEPVK